MTVNFSKRAIALHRMLASAGLALCAFLFLILGASAAQAQTVSLDKTSVAVPEGNAGTVRTTFQIRLSTPPSAPVTVTYGTSDDTAVAGSDYIAVSGAVTFAAGQTLKAVDVDVVGDTTYENAETFAFALLNTTAGNLSTSARTATIQINNDDAQPTLAIADAPAVTEGSNGDPSPVALFQVTLSAVSGISTTVNYSSIDYGATSSDYTPVSGTLTFNPGETVKTIAVTVTPDDIDELTEYFKVRLSNPSRAGLSRTEGQATILDDDAPAMYFLGDASANENDPSVTLFVVLDKASPESISVNYQTSDNTAVAGADYQSSSGIINFPPNSLTQQITIPLVDDTIQDGDKFFTVNLFGASDGVSVLDSQAIVTIKDNEGQPALSISNGQISEGTGTGNDMVFDVTMTPSSTQTVTVSYKTEEDTTLAANVRALEEVDFRSVTGTLTFLPGETAKQITVPLIGDSVTEFDEQFKVSLFSNVGAMFNTSSATGTILDDDVPVVGITAVNSSIAEGALGVTTKAQFNITLSQPSPKTVTVSYASADGTAKVADSDYTAKSNTVSFSPNTTTPKTFNVPITGDSKTETDENFTVSLSGANNATIDPTKGTATQIIANDDTALPVLTVNDVRLTEGTATGSTKAFVFNISIFNAGNLKPAVVGYPIDIDVTTADGTAVASTDYNPVTRTVTIPAGQSAVNVGVQVTQDALFENDETFTLNLKANPAQVNLTDPRVRTTATGTILDDDAAAKPTVSIPSGPFIVAELDSDYNKVPDKTKLAQITIPVTLDRPSGTPVTVHIETADGTDGTDANGAKSGEDYLPLDPLEETVVFPVGTTTQNVTLYINGDTINEKVERFTLNLSDPTDAIQGNPQTKIRITDNDKGGTVAFKGDPLNIFENSADGTTIGVYQVDLSVASGQDLVVNYTFQGSTGSPASQADVIAVKNNPTDINEKAPVFGQVIVPKGKTSATFKLQAVNDTVNEPLETYNLKLSAISDVTWTLPATVLTGTITDDDLGLDPKVPFTPDKGIAKVIDASGSPTVSVDATQVTITGNDFTAGGGTPFVFFTKFGDSGTPSLPATIIGTATATSIVVEVPVGALTGPIRVVRGGGSTVSSKDFVVQPMVSSFSPKAGVGGFTTVTINGVNLSSSLNPVTAVLFNGTPAQAFAVTPLGSGQGVMVDIQVPSGANSGKISLESARGGVGPGSPRAFEVREVTPGGVGLSNSSSSAVREGDNVLTNAAPLNGIHTFGLSLKNAIMVGSNIAIPPLTGNVTVEISATANPSLVNEGPEIAVVNSDGAIRRGNTISYDFLQGQTSQSTTVYLVDAGNDAAKGDAIITIAAKIVTTNDPNYPAGGANSSASTTVTRTDQHMFLVGPDNTVRTSETDQAPDASAPNFFQLYGERYFEIIMQGSNLGEPGLTTDGRPLNETVPQQSDVVVKLRSSDVGEGLVSYFLQDRNTGKFYTGDADGQPIPSAEVQVIFSANPARSDYYLNPHYIVVTGQDDALVDSAQRFDVVFEDVYSFDKEWDGINVGTSVKVVNADNEQGSSGQGYIYSPSNGTNKTPLLNTNENGTTDSFTVALRQAPTGPVRVTYTSTNPSVVKLIDPTDPTKNRLLDSVTVTFTRKDPSPPTLGTSRWDIPIRIFVKGVEDGIDQSAADGNDPQNVTIKATATSELDDIYNNIDPFDPVVVSRDNQTTGFNVSPDSLIITEAQSDNFTVKLGSRPTSDVTVNLVSTSKTVATINLTRLKFTSTTDEAVSSTGPTSTASGWNVPQKVIVTGVDDGSPLGDRTATIQLTAFSSDATYNTDPADVSVRVLDKDSATFQVNPSNVTVREGETGTFQVKLNGKPSANVVATFASNDASRIRLLVQGKVVDTVTLTFTPLNYSAFQTVSFSSLADDDTDSNVVSVVSTVSSSDTNYQSATPPQAQITITDTSGNNGGGGGVSTFEPNTTYAISLPYMPTSKTTEVGTPNQIFSLPLFTNGVQNYKLYAFAAKQQTGQLLPVGSETDTFPFKGYNEVKQGEILSRGRGYILINGANALSLKVPGTGQVYGSAAIAYSMSLSRNTAGVTGGNSRNGLNLVGFPFNPLQYQYVDFAKSTVVANGFTYDSIEKAAAAGVMSPDLYECLPNGKLSKVTQEQRYLRPFKAYYVQIFQDSVTLTLKDPTPNSSG